MPEQRPPGPSQLAQPILVVDDDPDIRELVRDVLESEGYLVAIAANSIEKIRMLEHQQPALVLPDMRMPVLSGWDFAAALRARGAPTPILVMTAARSARRWAEEIGAQGYLAKPFDLSEVLSAIERLLPHPFPGNASYNWAGCARLRATSGMRRTDAPPAGSG